MTSKKGLGRGLTDLGLKEILGDSASFSEDASVERIHKIDVRDIAPSPFQSRSTFDIEKLEALAKTIKQQGVIQPLILRKKSLGGYELIAGERRLRAAKIAGLRDVPCVLKENDNQSAALMNLLENLHREDLNVVEEALSLQKLIHAHRLTHAEIAETVGQSRSSISNKLRILQLEPDVLSLLKEGAIEMGHAKCLLSFPPEKQLRLAELVVKRKLSVRQLEQIDQSIQLYPQAPSPHIVHAQTRLTKALATKATIKQNAKGGGKISINYSSTEHLTQLLEQLTLKEPV
ncbi:MAG: chromosome partitioning protein ParB [Legionellales bacterium]|jgi:ParB family chromosome partitioning protein|nr:chromosome partitioning protein ParB [Legionellales bacterium]OUX66142.1 MAG: hypothetical protein CBE41_00760 [Gammaproteobacteria bacterium TMED281]